MAKAAKKKAKPDRRNTYMWSTVSGQEGFVKAHTTGEARALVKKLVGVNKNHPLPKTVHVVRV